MFNAESSEERREDRTAKDAKSAKIVNTRESLRAVAWPTLLRLREFRVAVARATATLVKEQGVGLLFERQLQQASVALS